MRTNKLLLIIAFIAAFYVPAKAQSTYCNPINIDYGYTPIPNFSDWGKHRATADPVIVMYKGDYYLFSTNQGGYWWSNNLSDWNFLEKSFLEPYHKVYDDLCAPAVWVQGDTMLVFGSTYSSSFPIWMSTNPKGNEWKHAIDSLIIGGWDPSFFVDDNGKLYMYNGSSNQFPIYGVELNRNTFQPMAARKELLLLNPGRFGWHRFGEHMDNTFLDPFIEGAWMTRHNGKYFLQYGAPGTEFSGYADGVAVSDHPLGPFTHQSLPVSFKAGGFSNGAGHGSTFTDKWGNYWHISTSAISVKNNFERRLGLCPAGFDKDNTMFCNTLFGDYPYYLPNAPNYNASSGFTGWMLLNYQKPVRVSSTLGGFSANLAVDENIRTYWSAATSGEGEFILSDLGCVSEVFAIQVNYADQDAEFLGKSSGVSHQYRIWMSDDEKHWKLLTDKSRNTKDCPHDYVQLAAPVKTRFLKLENAHMPTGKFAISGFRIFGHGCGSAPETPKELIVLRTESDKRSAWVKWPVVDNATGYILYIGTSPEKLYNSILIYTSNEYWLKTLDKEIPFYFAIQAFNENGVSAISEIIKTQ